MYFQRIINGTEQTCIYSTEDQAQRLMQATEVFKWPSAVFPLHTVNLWKNFTSQGNVTEELLLGKAENNISQKGTCWIYSVESLSLAGSSVYPVMTKFQTVLSSVFYVECYMAMRLV